MDDLCRFFIYFILFLVLYQYFNKVVEGHNVQSTAECSTAQNYSDCSKSAQVVTGVIPMVKELVWEMGLVVQQVQLFLLVDII